ncbi:histidine phosphatase family protein [Streptomyces sp. NPDC001537]
MHARHDDHPGSSSSRWQRARTRLDRIRPLLENGDVAGVTHGQLARVLTVRWLGLDASPGRLLGHPHPGTLSFLATEDGQPFIAARNVPKRRCRCLRPAGRGVGSA